MLDVSPQHHGILLMLFGSILSYLAKTSTTPFEFQVGKTKSTPESLLSFHEAFYGFIPEIAHITVFMICYILTWRLVLPLQPGVQIFLVLLLISAPLFYFPDLIRKASTLGVDVSCGSSFKLPLIGFTCIAAFGITLAFGLLTLLVVYLNRRFIHGRKSTRGQDIEVNSNDLINVWVTCRENVFWHQSLDVESFVFFSFCLYFLREVLFISKEKSWRYHEWFVTVRYGIYWSKWVWFTNKEVEEDRYIVNCSRDFVVITFLGTGSIFYLLNVCN